MTKNGRSLLVTGLILSMAFSSIAQRSNCGVNPQPNTIVQANGSEITLFPFGNEAIHYLESRNGYTLLFNKLTGNYEYATINSEGHLDLSGTTASDKNEQVMMKSGSFTPHLRYNQTQQSMLMQYFEEETKISQQMGKAGASVFPPFGDRKVLVLMVQYPDLPATIPTANFTLLMNQPNVNGTGSYRDYYLSATKNRLRLTSDVYGWFTADSGYKYYGKTSSPNYNSATKKLLIGAINAADSTVDFTQYDSDSDGYVDALILIHSGIGAEESSAPNSGDFIWSFRSTISSAPVKDGKKFSAYCMFPEKLYNGGSPIITGIGVIAHEFGHILDLPDLYATGYSNSGAGNYTIMAAGSWLNYGKTPSIFDAWSRITLGWNAPTVITSVGNYTIPYCVSDSNFAFRINTKNAAEYFLLESRLPKGFDKYLTSKGLAIWHVNTAHAGKLSTTGNNVNNDTAVLGLQLLQADGLREMERNINNGNAGDLFPGTSNNKNVTPFTKPSTNLQTSYQSTNIFITNITLNPDSSITFRFSSQPSAAFTPDKLTGCAPLNVSLTNNSLSASSFKWNFGNGTTNTTTQSPTIQYDVAGDYVVTLTVYDSLGIPSDSSVTSIKVYPSPKASYTYTQNGNKLNLSNTSSGSTAVQWQYYIGSTSYSSTSNSLSDLVVPDSGVFIYKLIAFNNYGCADTAYGLTHAFPTAVNEVNGLLSGINAYPNPFSDQFRLSVKLNTITDLTLSMYDIIGNKITTRATEKYMAGDQTILINDLSPLKSGIYLLKIQAGSEIKTIRLIKTE